MSTTHSSPSSQNLHATTPAPSPNAAVSTAVLMLSSLPPTRPPAPPALQRVPDPEVDEWAEKINRASSNGVEWLLSAGMHLKLAKAALDPGRWKGMFDSGKIKMGVRSAEMLMRIAGHSALAVTQNVSQLPPSVTALYALSAGSVEAVTTGIQSGDIYPEMTAKQARAFVRSQTGSPAPAKPATGFDPDKRRNRVQQGIKEEALKWPDAARCQLADLLEVLAKDIRASLPAAHQQP